MIYCALYLFKNTALCRVEYMYEIRSAFRIFLTRSYFTNDRELAERPIFGCSNYWYYKN